MHYKKNPSKFARAHTHTHTHVPLLNTKTTSVQEAHIRKSM